MSVELAVAYVNLVSSAKGLGKQVEKDLGEAGDKGGKVGGEKAASSFSSWFQKNIKRAGIGAGLAVGGLLVKGLVDAFAQSDATSKFKQSLNFAGIMKPQIEQATAITQKYADETVYDLTTIQNTAAQLAANGIKNFTDLTEAAGNLNAVAGGNADTFRSVAMVLTQTVGAGKLTTENWNQLADAIPGASGVLQKALLKNKAYTGNFRDAMAKGEITAKEFNKALLEVGNRPIAVQAARSTATFEGAFGNLMATVTGGFAKFLNNAKPQLTGFINGATAAFGEGFKILGGFVSLLGQVPGPLKVGAAALGAYVTLSKLGVFAKISSGVSGLVGRLRGLKSIGIGGVFKSIGPGGVVGLATTAIGFLGKAFFDARPKVVDFSAAIDDTTGGLAKNADAATAAALKSQLLDWNKLGGDVGVYTAAVEGNTKAQKAMTDEFVKLGRRTVEQSSTWKNYGSIFKQQGFTIADVVAALSDQANGNSAAFNNMRAKMSLAGKDGTAAMSALSAAYSPVRDAQQQYNTDVSGMNKQLSEATVQAKAAAGAQDINAESTKRASGATTAMNTAYDKARKALNENTQLTKAQIIAQGAAKESYYDTADAQQSLYLKYVQGSKASVEAGKAAHTLAGKLQDVAKAEQQAHDKAHNLIDAATQLESEMDRLSGRTPKIADATRAWNGAMQDAVDSAKDANGNVRKLGSGILKASGEIKTGTRAGARLYDTVTGLAKAARDQALAHAQAAGKARGQRAAEQALTKSLSSSRKQFVANAKQLGLTAAQAKKLADRYFGIPKTVTTVIKGKFTDVTKKLQRIADSTVHVKIQGRYIGTTGLPTKSFSTAMNFAAKGAWVTGGQPNKDSVPYMLMPGEAVIPKDVARENFALVNALVNDSLASYRGPQGARTSQPVAASPAGPAQMTGNLYLSSGELLGVIRGVVRQDSDRAGRRLAGAR